MGNALGKTMKEIGNGTAKNASANIYIGDCHECGLMLFKHDIRCPRCDKKVKVKK